MKLTVAKIAAMTVHERRQLLTNALASKSTDAAQVLAMIEEVGRPDLPEEQVRLDDAIGKRMEKVIFSSESRAAAIEATKRGEPAMAAIDPLLVSALGRDYRSLNGATAQAGYLVARMMNKAGYEQTGKKGPLRKGATAKTAEIYRKKFTR